MVPALGIASSLLSDVGYKAIKGLFSGKSSGNAGSSLPAGLTGAAETAGQNLPGKITRGDLASLFNKVDTDGDGKISKQEFMDFKQQVDQTLSALLQTQESAAKSGLGTLQTQADKVFSAMDTDGDGKVSASELAQALQRRHHHHQPDATSTTQASTSSSSTSGDGTGQGQTSPAEFLTALLNLQASG